MERIDTARLKDLLNDTTQKIESAHDNIAINTIVENLVTSVIGSEFSSLWAFDESKALLLRERSKFNVRKISMLGQHGILARCFFTLSAGIYNYIASEKEYLHETDNPDGIRIKSKIIIPLLDNDRLVGMLTAYSSVRKIKHFTADDMEILDAMTPFLINVIYRMHPQMKIEDVTRVQIGKRLIETSSNLVEKVKEIKQEQETVETPDTTLTFLANTVHDIRTPANSLYGFLELLENQLDNPRLLQYIQNAKESAQFINELTTSILDRVSSQRERTKVEPTQLSPTRFFANIAEIFSANMFNKNITFNVYIDPLIPKEIITEAVILKRVIMNLIGNAYKFTPTGKTIYFSVKYKKATESLRISVEDTGIGIAKERQNEIFNAFTQAEEDTSENYGGTGLGLSISAQYVKDLGGKLKIKSTLDVGSTFYFNIPIEVTNSTPTFKPVHNKKINIGILLADQNIFANMNLLRYLRQMGLSDERVKPIISITDTPKKMSHLICFQDQFNDDVINFTQNKNIELLVVEESFLSLMQHEESSVFSVVSQHGYYANTLHTFIANRVPMRVLVVDDDRINIQLIKAILEEEFCQIDTAMDGEAALKMLKISLVEKEPYALVYLDKHMPKLSGSEAINQFRIFEKSQNVAPVYAVSITGDTVNENRSNTDFNSFVNKPFNKKTIKETLRQVRLEK